VTCWSPGPDQEEHSTVAAFMRWLEQERGQRFLGYAELWRWSSTVGRRGGMAPALGRGGHPSLRLCQEVVMSS
jgi:hypothetical protein